VKAAVIRGYVQQYLTGEREDLDFITLPGLDMASSRIALGTMTFGEKVDATQAQQMVDVCLDAGVNMFDTANAYTKGDSERFLGQAIKQRREEVILVTKAHHRMGPDPIDFGLAPAALRKAVTDSLDRLDADVIDVLYFHEPDWEVPFEESYGAAMELVHDGTVRTLALSNYPSWELSRVHVTTGAIGWPKPHVHQVMYNMLSRQLDDEYAAFSARNDMINVIYNPLAGGLLSGRYSDVNSTPTEGRFANPNYRNRYWNPTLFDGMQRLQQLANDSGLSLIELSFGWLWSRPLADIVLLGASSMEQLEANLKASQQPPVDADIAAVCDEVWSEVKGPVAKYWR